MLILLGRLSLPMLTSQLRHLADNPMPLRCHCCVAFSTQRQDHNQLSVCLGGSIRTTALRKRTGDWSLCSTMPMTDRRTSRALLSAQRHCKVTAVGAKQQTTEM